MKVIELKDHDALDFNELLEAAQAEDILLLRDGRPLVRLEKFDDEDWEDLKYESSPEALEVGRQAREQYARGEYKTLEQVKEELGIKKPEPTA